MPLAFYMDHHVPRAVTLGLRLRGVDVLTAYEDGAILYAALDKTFFFALSEPVWGSPMTETAWNV
jgi:hypothetical protein